MAKDASGLVKEAKGDHLLQICFKYVVDVLGFFADKCREKILLGSIGGRVECCRCVHRHGSNNPNAPP